MSNRSAWLRRSLVSLLLLAGCAPAEPGVARSRIINGVESGADDDYAVGIGIFSSGQFTGACSGVLVAPNVVLTARHCVSRVQNAAIGCDLDGNPIAGGAVYDDYAPGDLGILVGPVLGSVTSHAMKIFHTTADNLCSQDIAALLLDVPVTNAPFAKVRLDSAPVEGELIAAIGWGVSNNSQGYGRRRRDNIPIKVVGPSAGLSSGTMDVGPNEFLIGEGICEGDSGGPAVDMQTRAVVGLVSRGGNGLQNANDPSAGCVDTATNKTQNVYTRTDSFKSFIDGVFAESGTDPWEENGPDPRKAKFGETCTGPDACRSSLCVVAAGGQICSQPCDGTDGSCPDGYSCTAVGADNACTPTPPAKPVQTGGCSAAPTRPAPIGVLGLLLAIGLALRRRAHC